MNHLPNTVFDLPAEGTYKWSGRDEVPPVGSRVEIFLNGWEGCIGSVVGYRVDEGMSMSAPSVPEKWLGVCVHVDRRPGWHVSENPQRDVVYFVGREIRSL